MIGDIEIHDEIVRRAFERAPLVMAKRMDKTVDRVAMFLVREIQREYRGMDAIAFSTLIQSIHKERTQLGERMVRAGVKYVKYVETGTQPGYRGMPPLRPLAEWLRIKKGFSEKEARRHAYGLAKYLQVHGTKAKPAFKTAYNKNSSVMKAMLHQGVDQGIREGLGVGSRLLSSLFGS